MPKILDKKQIPGLKGTVVLNGSGTSAGKYFYREWDKATRSYRSEMLEGATDIDEACEQAIEVAFKFRTNASKETDAAPIGNVLTTPSGRIKRQKKVTVIDAGFNWIGIEKARLDSGLIKQSTYDSKELLVRMYLLPYLAEQSVVHTHQIDHNTFRDYLVFRAKTTAIVRAREISTLKEWVFNYLMPNRLLTEMPTKSWFPSQKVRQTDRMRNPAVNPDDWKVIINYVRGTWREHLRKTGHQNHRAFFWRDLFWHFLLFAKNTGMSPEEILKLKWKDVEIKDVGRIDSKGERQEWLVAYVRTIRSKTSQAREIPCNQGRELKRWMGYIKDYLKKYNIKDEVTGDTLVFGNPNHNFKAYSYSLYGMAWRDIYKTIQPKLRGHKFSPHDYTIYSLRSTFIENHLLKGTDLFLIARIAGHDVKELMKSYERMDIRARAKEITSIDFGRKEEKEYAVDLISSNEEEQAFDAFLNKIEGTKYSNRN